MWKTLLVLLPSMVNADISVYRKVGDTVVLIPQSPVNSSAPISTIQWKHGPDLAVDWVHGELQAYRHFNNRSALNISTGALTITGLTGKHGGRYEAEINSEKPTDSTLLIIVAPVSKPTVSTRCDLEMTFCLFTCEGNTTGAEPITYRWLPGGDLGNSTKLLNVTKENGERSFSCQVENPVSSQSSDPMPNPFTARNRMWILTCLIPVGGAVLFCVLFLKCKKENSTML